ncbi:MAG: hypothetical protein KTR31_16120 [Myxococcales bacterium]|nr:hypothetical protein [Myxococcales bacterium]
MMWLTLGSVALAEIPDVHDPKRPIALGSRAGVWTGPYSAPAVGGHITLRASRWLGLVGFADHTLLVRDATARHDHILGFSAYTPKLLGGRRWYVSPTLGACVDFRMDTPLAGRVPSATDVLFGTHAGVAAEAAIGRGWSVRATAQGFLYVGNSESGDGWSVGTLQTLRPSGVAQLLAGLSYTL